MRGTLHGPSQFGDISRFIPAGAGNTERFQRRSVGPSVYPRWRGEHDDVTVAGVVTHGLSPLARVTLCAQNARMTTGRFIPAGAGNTFRNAKEALGVTVYPRWRGEHMNRPDDAEYRAGLSPLARGTQRPCAPGSGCVRFIPAGAGNTQRECAGFNWTPVYPRWRGEHEELTHRYNVRHGLSPLAWGTPNRSAS